MLFYGQDLKQIIIKDTWSYYGMNIWNNLPTSIRNVDNLKCFKEKYITYLDVHMNE